jgi:hypothetical protein
MPCVRLFLFGLALTIAGCGSGDTSIGSIMLSWSFVDGRSCADSGASNVAFTWGSSQLGNVECNVGLAPASTMVMVPHSGTLTVAALSPVMNAVYPTPPLDLYEGKLGLDEALLPATVTLYATAAR